MKKISLLTVFFLISCSDVSETSKEKSELEKCIDANVSLIRQMDGEVINDFPALLKLPVKLDLNFLISGFVEELGNEAFNQNLNKLGNKDTALASFKYLQDNGFLSKNININLDSDEVYFTLVKNNKIVDLQSFLGDETHSDEMLEEFKPFLASTIKSTNNNTLSEIAQNVCWSQSIY